MACRVEGRTAGLRTWKVGRVKVGSGAASGDQRSGLSEADSRIVGSRAGSEAATQSCALVSDAKRRKASGVGDLRTCC